MLLNLSQKQTPEKIHMQVFDVVGSNLGGPERELRSERGKRRYLR